MNDILQYLRNLLQIVFAPARGWEDLEAEQRKRTPEEENRSALRMYYTCFLPVIGLCAVSRFARIIYGDGNGWLGCFQVAIITFVSLFLAAQIARWLMGLVMPRLVGDDPRYESGLPWHRGRVLEMICYSLSFMALIFMLSNVIKVRIALVEFLPFYSIFIIWKGWRYVGIRERNVGLFMIAATAAIVGSLYMLSFLLNAVV